MLCPNLGAAPGVATAVPATIRWSCPYIATLMNMPNASNQASRRLRSFWRKLFSAIAIYALVMQPVLLTAGESLSVQASLLDEVSLSQLCLHNADGNPVAPADQHPAHQHCLQCLSGAFVLLDAPQSSTFTPADRQSRKIRHSGHELGLSLASRYSAARPRGPPLSV
jgi:hypothetical protein